jgi:tRNA (guanine37-N1)-methyltransferase
LPDPIAGIEIFQLAGKGEQGAYGAPYGCVVKVTAESGIAGYGETDSMPSIIDAVIRLIPGVLGDEQSAADESHSEAGRLEYPQFTRPRNYRGLEVPETLLSGNHKAIADWRREQSDKRTRDRIIPGEPGA